MSDNDWGIDPQNLTAPPFLNPDDAGFVLGTDVPPCMQATYAAVFRLKPNGAGAGGLNANPQWFFGVRFVNSTVDFGWLIYDAGTVCGFRVVWTWQGTNRLDGLGTITDTLQMGGLSVGGLPAFFASELNIGSTSGAVAPPVYTLNINKGDTSVRPANPRTTPWTVDGIPMGRGVRAFASRNTATGFTPVELVALQTTPVTIFNGSAYLLEFEGDVESTAANAYGFVNIRRTNIAGTVLRLSIGSGLPSVAGLGETIKGSAIVTNTSGADMVDVVLATITPAVAGQVRVNAAANRLAYLRVTDIGSAGLYPGCTPF